MLNVADHFDSFDVSSGSIDLSRKLAAQSNLTGISYITADLNKAVLEKNKYSCVFASMSLHHIENLEGLFEQVESALVPGGLFIFNEYVGPNRFQWTDQQLRWINLLLTALPEKYKRDIATPGIVKMDVKRVSIEQMIEIDPTEAVRSDSILPIVYIMFEEIKTVRYGGTILHMLLDRIGGNFQEVDKCDKALLQIFCSTEAELVDSGVLPSDFVVCVLRKRALSAKEDIINWTP